MIVILDTAKGKALNFTTRKDAGEFIGVSLPVLRGWLKHPFFLHKSLIITLTSNEKVQASRQALFEKKVQKCSKPIQKIERLPCKPKSGHVPINGSQS